MGWSDANVGEKRAKCCGSRELCHQITKNKFQESPLGSYMITVCGIVNYLVKQTHCLGGRLTAKSLLPQVMGFSPLKDIWGTAVKMIPIDCQSKKWHFLL